MYIVTVLFKINAADFAQFMAAMVSNAETSLQNEPECHQFDVCASHRNPDEVFLYEVYSSKAAFDEHLASNHFLAFNALTSEWVKSKAVNLFERVGP